MKIQKKFFFSKQLEKKIISPLKNGQNLFYVKARNYSLDLKKLSEQYQTEGYFVAESILPLDVTKKLRDHVEEMIEKFDPKESKTIFTTHHERQLDKDECEIIFFSYFNSLNKSKTNKIF